MWIKKKKKNRRGPLPLPGRREGSRNALNSDLTIDDLGTSHWASVVPHFHHQDEATSQPETHGAVQADSRGVTWLLSPRGLCKC